MGLHLSQSMDHFSSQVKLNDQIDELIHNSSVLVNEVQAHHHTGHEQRAEDQLVPNAELEGLKINFIEADISDI